MVTLRQLVKNQLVQTSVDLIIPNWWAGGLGCSVGARVLDKDSALRFEFVPLALVIKSIKIKATKKALHPVFGS